MDEHQHYRSCAAQSPNACSCRLRAALQTWSIDKNDLICKNEGREGLLDALLQIPPDHWSPGFRVLPVDLGASTGKEHGRSLSALEEDDLSIIYLPSRNQQTANMALLAKSGVRAAGVPRRSSVACRAQVSRPTWCVRVLSSPGSRTRSHPPGMLTDADPSIR